MKTLTFLALLLAAWCVCARADVSIDQEAFGKALGGWEEEKDHSGEYTVSGSSYRTYRPVCTPTPDGGIFVSVRIDHVRGWLAADDHASLEITIDSQGHIQSAQSNVAIQGRSISSDLIRSGNIAGQQLSGVDRAVKIGTDLVADMSAKLLREKIVEAGRVSFPAVIRHNYNHIFQSIRVAPAATRAEILEPTEPAEDPPPPQKEHNQPRIKPYQPDPQQDLEP